MHRDAPGQRITGARHQAEEMCALMHRLESMQRLAVEMGLDHHHFIKQSWSAGCDFVDTVLPVCPGPSCTSGPHWQSLLFKSIIGHHVPGSDAEDQPPSGHVRQLGPNANTDGQSKTHRRVAKPGQHA